MLAICSCEGAWTRWRRGGPGGTPANAHIATNFFIPLIRNEQLLLPSGKDNSQFAISCLFPLDYVESVKRAVLLVFDQEYDPIARYPTSTERKSEVREVYSESSHPV
jgi:hypothetical protein